MSDLDQSIRAELETAYWRLSRRTSSAADKGARAIFSMLDLHPPIDVHDMTVEGEPPPVYERACRHCSDEEYVAALDNGELVAFGDGVRWPCATVRAIADALGVSSQDTPPAPRPARAEPKWKNGDRVSRPAWKWVGTVWSTAPERNRYRVQWDHLRNKPKVEGSSWCTAEELVALSEVVSSGTDGDTR